MSKMSYNDALLWCDSFQNNTLYVVEDITGTHTDPYHYKLYFHTEFPIDVDVKP